MNKRVRQINEWLATLPSFVWLVVLFLVPTFVIFASSFKPADPFGGIGKGWTLGTIFSLSNPNYPAIVWRTIWVSIVTTVICVVLAIPAGFCIARAGKKARRILLLLVIVPFWTSFLVRVFAWKVLLHPDGLLKQVLVFIHLVRPEALLLYNAEAVLLVMVYTYLPFAILPIYAAAERFDFSLLEAARDLGASRFMAFLEIFIPGIQRGLITAFLVVFIPALGSYVVPDLVGGMNSEMIGNRIAQRTFSDRNLPHASALSAVLTLAVLVPLLIWFWLQRKRGEDEATTIIETS